jgi:iron complex outermembrane receptor protein/vitamin B12 transporter
MRYFERRWSRALFLCIALFLSRAVLASTVQGTVADPLGARIAGAEVQLLAHGAVVAHAKTSADGEFLLDAPEGRYTLVVHAAGFELQQSESFFVSGARTLAPAITLAVTAASQSVTVTTAGVPTTSAQVSSSVTVIGGPDLENRENVIMPIRLSPGVSLVQSGQVGGVASLNIRGGSSTANKVLIDGVPADDIGGRFDFSTVSTSDLDTIEIYRGPDSVLFGSDAAAGVVSITTRKGSTSLPMLEYAADGGNFGTLHTVAGLSGTAGRLDYFGGLDVLNTDNSLPLSAFHDTTSSANLGWALNSRNSLRVSARNSDSGVGVPNAWGFYGIADPAKQSDQDLYLAGTYDSQTTDKWHNLVRYGGARKREQYTQYGTNGIPDDYGDFLGQNVTVNGANGYSVTGQAILDYGGTVYPYTDSYVSNRDQLYAQSDYKFNAHTVGLFGFRYENERGVSGSAYSTDHAKRTNYDYTVQIAGDIKNRLFYSLGGGVQKNQVFGTEADPRVGLAYYLVKPGNGAFQGTKVMFNFAKGLQEPSVIYQTGSLYDTLLGLPCPPSPCGPQLIQQYNIAPIGALRARSYDGGVEQVLFHQRAVLRGRYFHNEFGSQVEYVYTQALADLGVSQSVVTYLLNEGVYGAYVNSLNYSAQGAEAEVELQPLAHVFVRAGYTYVDAKVQKSFSSDALGPAVNPLFPNVPIGAYSPLIGARPFRIPPQVGFFSATYQRARWFVALTGSLVSRQDDSTFLSDQNYGNTLLLPNRDLDPSSERLDLGGSYAVKPWMSVYTQVNNLLSQQRAGVLGYPALPLSFRSGLKFAIGGKQ